MALSRRAFLSGVAGVAGSAALAAVVVEHRRTARAPARRPAADRCPPHGAAPSTTAAATARQHAGRRARARSSWSRSTAATTAEHRRARRRSRVRQAARRPRRRSGDGPPAGRRPRARAGMTGFKGLWDAGQLAVVRGVAYPNPNRSHFRSMDIWQSGDPAGVTATGWLGRWLDVAATTPLDGVAIGSTLPLVLAGEHTAGAAIPTGGTGAAADRRDEGRVAGDADAGGRRRRARWPAPPSRAPICSPSPPPSAPVLAAAHRRRRRRRPRRPARHRGPMIRAGLPTRAYVTSMGGFDTHANEGPTHPALLADLDAAVGGFFQSLAGDPRGAVGRRSSSTRSSGAARRPTRRAAPTMASPLPCFVAGPPVRGGFVGDEPSLTAFDDNGDLVWNVDFRSIYAIAAGRRARRRPRRRPARAPPCRRSPSCAPEHRKALRLPGLRTIVLVSAAECARPPEEAPHGHRSV